MKKIHLETIDSTNQYLKEHHRELVDFCYVQTDRQTAGRGRLGRIWIDEGGCALFSLLLKNDLRPETADLIPLLAAMAVHKTVSNYVMNVKIKWPNDIVVQDKKLAGILVEAVSEGNRLQAVIVGVGINVNNVTFSEDIAAFATSLRLQSRREHRIENLVDEVIKVFALEYIHFQNGDSKFIDYCNKYSSLQGRTVAYRENGIPFEGKVKTILPDGRLAIETAEGVHPLRCGEVTLSVD